MTRVRVKICGITNAEDLHTAVDAGANAVGFVIGFPRSPRNLSVSRAKELMEQVPVFVDTVAVVPMTEPAVIRAVAKRCQPALLQLHGGAPTLRRPRQQAGHLLIRSLSAKDAQLLVHAQAIHTQFDAILLDSHVANRIGGTGQTHDWRLSARIREEIAPTSLILAGGLNPSNVERAIVTVRPDAVDVSSGVERAPGRKDPLKVRKFIRRVLATEP